MTVHCPKCQAEHELATRPPGERFVCSCGEGLTAPKTEVSRWWPSPRSAVLLLLFGVPCLVGGFRGLRSFVMYGMVSKAMEARVNLAGIRAAELAYYQAHGTLIAAGPSPAGFGSQKRPWAPDDGFAALGWRPEGAVYHQYQVQLTGPATALLTARGDIDGDGVVAEYRARLEVGKPHAPPESLTPDVY